MNECGSRMVNRMDGKVLYYIYMTVALKVMTLLVESSLYISSPWFGSYTLNLLRYLIEIARMQNHKYETRCFFETRFQKQELLRHVLCDLTCFALMYSFKTCGM